MNLMTCGEKEEKTFMMSHRSYC